MNDIKVQQFLDELENIDPIKFKILNQVLDKIEQINPEVKQRIMYGGIMLTAEEDDVAGIFVRKNHVSLEFTSGFLLNDPEHILEGSGKYRRHIKIQDIFDLEEKNISCFLKQIL